MQTHLDVDSSCGELPRSRPQLVHRFSSCPVRSPWRSTLLRTLIFLFRVLWAMISVLPLRLLRGRRRPTWTLREEIVWSAVRRLVLSSNDYGFEWMRKMESLLPSTSPLFKTMRFENARIADLPCLWCIPEGVDVGNRVVLYFHGGGYTVGSSRMYREIMARLAIDGQARVLAVDYRLAPEFPFPAAHDDCLAIYRSLLSAGTPASRIVLAGDSAGGGLVLGTLITARDEGTDLPAAALLFSPWVDPWWSGGSMSSNAEEDVIEEEFLRNCIQAYVGDSAIDDPRVKPLDAGLAGLPPMLVQVGDAEVFLDQDREFAARAARAGVDVSLKVYEDVFHTFQNYSTVLPRAEAAVMDSTMFLRKQLEEARNR